jgi:hypothetical protein
MTAQRPDVLIYRGKNRSLLATPLDVYLKAAHPKKLFMPVTTALWRGYVATWVIQGKHLYLQAVKGWTTDRERDGTDCMDLLFPGHTGPVFAHWVYRELRVANGPIQTYVHGGFGSKYQSELVFQVDDGRVVEAKTVRYDS